jgi:ribosomal-protein-alanine N-acetyltransferase
MSSLAPPLCSPADATHIDAMMAVMRASFDPGWGEAWSEAQLASGLMLQGNFARRIETPAGGTLGFSLCRGAADEVELLLIAVRPAARGNGLGRALLTQAIADSRERRMSQIFLEVRESNAAAIGLYCSSGFSEVGRRKDYYLGAGGARFGAITMRCAVQQ